MKLVATGSQCRCLSGQIKRSRLPVRQYLGEVNVSHTVSVLLYASLTRCIYRAVHNGGSGVWGILNSICLCPDAEEILQ